MTNPPINTAIRANTAGLAWSPPQAHGAEAAAWWSQRVVFDSRQTRRIDLAHALASQPGMTEPEARRLLETVPVADGRAGLRSPWYLDARVYFNNRPTTRREVRAILEAHQVPASYVVQFLDTAETVDDDEPATPLASRMEWEQEAILASVQGDLAKMSPEDRQRFDHLQKQIEELRYGKTAG